MNLTPLIGITTSIFLLSQNPTQDKFNTLKRTLENYNFNVKIEPPPLRSTYGLLQVKTRTIWINPIVFDLQIALPTLIHEATHAAQLCAGKNEITALNLSLSPPNIARPYFTHYNHGLRRHLEAEAYAVQTHPEGYDLVISLLNKHCE
ncbi:hypothetical protein H6G11_15800 [Cyanobacterium aponinum FACHB-4101]|uniref:Uncharacterized protein n=1 Tax=Cyanobacterium aponinum 0216 TaxID=2676140 RepID=A0A844GZQ9_9CHRO|nr:hypothetical protein [Cyanobacterium aponinum]MBD2395708.1 hypothetical protein [Cyanobacterium aponinum FACHB-4101]MTF39625.1 hypothetical protein [Cyanobacterium aponinum 0216]